MLGTSKIIGMTGSEKADLFAKGARAMDEGRYVATLALASLARSQACRDLGYANLHALAAARTSLQPWEVTQMLWVGKKLLDHPELDEAFRNGTLSWAKVKALVPHVSNENVTEWIGKARKMSSNALEHLTARGLDPVVGEKMVPIYVPEHARRRLQELVKRKRAKARDQNLTEAECFLQMLDREEAAMADQAAMLQTMGPILPVPHSPDRSRHIPAVIQEAALKRARYCCERCGNRHALMFHHSVIPFAEGGPHCLANIEVVCSRCHDQLHAEESALRRRSREAQVSRATNTDDSAAVTCGPNRTMSRSEGHSP
jgi:hypothetical protein